MSQPTFSDLAGIEADYAEIWSTSAVFHAEQENTNENAKTNQKKAEKLKSSKPESAAPSRKRTPPLSLKEKGGVGE